ncbi:hypothetical protein ACS0TV_30275, partial [Klebsiella pneumoniae]
GKTLFISRKTYRIDGSGQMAITVGVEVASNTPHPARIGLTCQLAQVAERVNWLGLGPQENYPDRLTAACFDRWDLPLSDMYTPYDSWSPSVSAEFHLSAGSYHYQLLWCQK